MVVTILPSLVAIAIAVCHVNFIFKDYMVQGVIDFMGGVSL